MICDKLKGIFLKANLAQLFKAVSLTKFADSLIKSRLIDKINCGKSLAKKLKEL